MIVSAGAFLNVSAGAWTALGTWATVAVAVIAAVVGYRQIIESRRLRDAQAQPYVVVFIEEAEGPRSNVDLVVKNFGRTAATEIRVELDGALDSAVLSPEHSPVRIPEIIPSLAPGQEWRTFWDSLISRKDSSLPMSLTGRVSFRDFEGRKKFKPTSFVLDLQVLMDRGYATAYRMHDAAGALREIKTILASWQEPDRTGLRILARDGDQKDVRQADLFETQRRQREREE
jgi:hypothetical protein